MQGDSRLNQRSENGGQRREDFGDGTEDFLEDSQLPSSQMDRDFREAQCVFGGLCSAKNSIRGSCGEFFKPVLMVHATENSSARVGAKSCQYAFNELAGTAGHSVSPAGSVGLGTSGSKMFSKASGMVRPVFITGISSL